MSCRGQAFLLTPSRNKYPIVEYKAEIRQCFGVNTESDLDDVHPPFFCAKCMATIPIRDKRNLQQCPDTSNAGCGAAVVWEPHDKSVQSVWCAKNQRVAGLQSAVKPHYLVPPTLSVYAALALSMALICPRQSFRRGPLHVSDHQNTFFHLG